MKTTLVLSCIASLFAAPVWAQDARTVIRFPIVQALPHDLGLRIRQLVSEAHHVGAGAIVLDLDVWEGDVDHTADAVAEMDASGVPIYVLVTGVAMADPLIAIPGVADSTVLLSLDAGAAGAYGLASTVDGLDALLDGLGLGHVDVVTASIEGLTSTTVRIRNNSWRDVRVYLVRGGSRQRLGLVTAMGQGDFSLAYRVAAGGSGIRLLVESVGTSESLATDLIRPLPGLLIRWDIHNNLRMSSYSLIHP